MRPERAERPCRLDWCHREAMRNSLLCPEHTTDDWMGRLPAWRRRVIDPEGEGATRGGLARDESGRQAA